MTTCNSRQLPRSVGIIGYGQFGKFIHTLLDQYTAGCVVHTYDVAQDAEPALQRAAQADVVVLAVPINQYETVLRTISQLTPITSVVIDVATVKEVTEEWCRTYIPTHQYICAHPMFGPTSYQKSGQDITGFRCAITHSTLSSEQYKRCVDWLELCGLRIIHLSGTQHDKYLAETLFLTHLVAQAVTAAKFVRTDIDTVSFGFLMDAVESVRGDTSLFQDVYQHNPYCKAVVQKLSDALAEVQSALDARL